MYGRPSSPEITDPIEMILLENVAYLVPDERRREARRERALQRTSLSLEDSLQTLKLSPQPQDFTALGLRNWKPAPRRPPFQSISVPSR